jgi:hypothetical protein
MPGSAQYASQQGLVCCICAQPVPLETSKTDEGGNAVHEECYVSRTIRKFHLDDPMRLPADWLSSVLARFELRLRVTDNC